jgi:hypothetical protein
MISEKEAISIALAVGTAMLNNDKEAREMAYADLDSDSLKRVIRWVTRLMLHNLSFVAAMSNQDMNQMWGELCMAQFLKEDENGQEEA